MTGVHPPTRLSGNADMVFMTNPTRLLNALPTIGQLPLAA
jgi:hypothetical protein